MHTNKIKCIVAGKMKRGKQGMPVSTGWTAVAGYVRVFKCVRVKASGRWEGGVSRQAYHPRSPPVNSGGQTISLIEFNPGSPQEARRLVALLSMERVGGGGGGSCVHVDGMRRAFAGPKSQHGEEKRTRGVVEDNNGEKNRQQRLSWLRGEGRRGDKGQEAREMEASCSFQQVTKSKHAQVFIGTDLKRPPRVEM